MALAMSSTFLVQFLKHGVTLTSHHLAEFKVLFKVCFL